MSIILNSTNDDSNSRQLRLLLETIASQLTVPFLERRSRNKSHRLNPVEELQDTVAELVEKERELTAAVGIAKMLLDKNDSLQQKNNNLLISFNKLSEENRIYIIEINNYRELLEQKEVRYEIISNTLVKTETELLRSCVDQQRLIFEKDNSKAQIFDTNFHENDIFEIKDHYEKEVEKYKSINYLELMNEIEKKHSKCLSEKEKIEENYENLSSEST